MGNFHDKLRPWFQSGRRKGGRVAVLCAGPSLAHLRPQDLRPYRWVIAVNRAIKLPSIYPIHRWFMYDVPNVGCILPFERNRATFKLMIPEHLSDRLKVTQFDTVAVPLARMQMDMCDGIGFRPDFVNFSSTTAGAIALWGYGAVEVDFFGMDMCGQGGYGIKGLYPPEVTARWERENNCFRKFRHDAAYHSNVLVRRVLMQKTNEEIRSEIRRQQLERIQGYTKHTPCGD